jgi:hypothetical protein
MNPDTTKRPNAESGTPVRRRLMQRKLAAWTRAACILSLFLLVTLSPAQPVTVTPVGEWPGFQRGPAQAVAVADGYAYVAAGGVYIFDTSQLSNLVPVGIYATPDARDVVVIGQYAYVADWETGLQIVDVSDPAYPRRVGECSINGQARRLVMRDNYAYVAAAPIWDGQSNQGGGLQVVDISNPANPQLVGEYPYFNPPCAWCGGSAYDVAVSGNYAYLAEAWDETSPGGGEASGALAVIDISDPTSPWPVTSYDTSSYGARSVTIAGSMAYVGNYNSFDGLQILDISNPTHPVRVGGYRLDSEEPHVTVSGNYAYLAMPSGLEGVSVLDISNPANPVRVTGITLQPSSSARGSAVMDGKLYVAGDAGLFVFDVAQPENPVLLGDYNTSIHGASRLAVSGQHTYLVEGYVGLHILDVASPQQALRLGTNRTEDYAHDVAISGHFAYLTEASTPWGSGQDVRRLQVIDVSNPATPERVGGIDLGPSQGGLLQRVAVSGGYAYVTGSAWELSESAPALYIIDVRDSVNPSRVGTYVSTWSITGVVISGGHAYLTTYWYDPVAGRDRRRLEIVNVTDPTNPQRVGTIDDPSGVAIQGTRAYLGYASYDDLTGQHSGALRVFDISNPAVPTLLGEISTSGPVWQVAVAYGYAWLVGRSGLERIEITNLQNLQPIVAWEPPDPGDWNPQQVTVSNHHVFIANSSRSLHILRIDGLPEEVRLTAQAAGVNVQLAWSATATGFAPESSTDPAAMNWDPVAGTPQLNGDQYEMTVPADGPARFFRLRKP